jgi:hypothetical protein
MKFPKTTRERFPAAFCGGLRMPRLVIIVVTSAGLLSAPIHLTEDFADGRRFADDFRPADVEAGEIAHGERSHG